MPHDGRGAALRGDAPATTSERRVMVTSAAEAAARLTG